MNEKAEQVLKSIQATISAATAPQNDVVIKQQQVNDLIEQLDQIVKSENTDMNQLQALRDQISGFLSGSEATEKMDADQFKQYADGQVEKAMEEGSDGAARIEALQENVSAFIEAAKGDDFESFDVKVFETKKSDDTDHGVTVDGKALLGKVDDLLEQVKAKWTTKQINDLPDSSFLYIEDGGSKDDDGKTTPRGKRHFPIKNESGDIDIPHLRNAIARIPQSNLSDALKSELQDKARKMLEAANKADEQTDADKACKKPARKDGDNEPDQSGKDDQQQVGKSDDQWPLDMNDGRELSDVDKWGTVTKSADDASDYDFGQDPDYNAA